MKNLKLHFNILITLLLFSCSSGGDDYSNTTDPTDPDPDPVDVSSATIWKGATVTFTKADNTNPSQPANQDNITSNVKITRGQSGGWLYNIAKESSANKSVSPKGTRWAVGNINQVNSLSFGTFNSKVGKPKNALGKNLVVHLVDDNIVLSLKITSWSQGSGNGQGGGGGFSYERSSE